MSDQETEDPGSQPENSLHNDSVAEHIEAAAPPLAENREEFVLEADSEQSPKEIALILAIVDSGFFKFMAFTMIFVGIASGIVRQNIVQFAVGIRGGIVMLNVPEILRNILAAPPEGPSTSNDISGTGILIVLAIGIVIVVGYNLVKQNLWRRRLNDLNVVLASISEPEGQRQNPAREEQMREARDGELAPISNSFAEELEVDKRRRKIILD